MPRLRNRLYRRVPRLRLGKRRLRVVRLRLTGIKKMMINA